MRIRWTFRCAALLLAFAAAAQARDGRLLERWRAARAPGVAASPRIDGPGDYRFELVQDGALRAYLVHVPASYRAGAPMPLLLALHGGGGDMDRQADDSLYGIVSASERRGFVAVFPNGATRFPGGRLATWNAGRCCAYARDTGVDDVGVLRRVVGDVESRLAIDRSRVYATGMSNGGMMAYRLACEAADVFRAIASVAGTDNTLGCTPSKPVAVLHIHARDDDHVLFDGGAGVGAFRDRSRVTDFTSVPATVAKWSAMDGCSAPPRRVLEVPGAYCELRAPCRDGTAVQLCVTRTGGHSWPGGRKPRGAPSQAIDANAVMWSFFESLPRR